MFTKFSLLQRLQIGLILGIAFLLVLGSNRLHKKHFSEINHTVNSVYKDRVVVQSYIYQLINIFHQKELQLIQGKELSGNATNNEKVKKLLIDFSMTELTPHESSLLNDLNRQFKKLTELESKMVQPSEKANNAIDLDAIKMLHEIKKSLDGLTEVQLDEGNQQTLFSQSSLHLIMILSNIEIAFVVLIGIIILVLFFYPHKTSGNQSTY